MDIKEIVDISKFEFEIKHHVFKRAMQRGIHPDRIEDTLKKGKIERFGKNYIKFVTRSLVCVGEISGLKIKIMTIERRKYEKMFRM